jgi:hypothetical protein
MFTCMHMHVIHMHVIWYMFTLHTASIVLRHEKGGGGGGGGGEEGGGRLPGVY